MLAQCMLHASSIHPAVLTSKICLQLMLDTIPRISLGGVSFYSLVTGAFRIRAELDAQSHSLRQLLEEQHKQLAAAQGHGSQVKEQAAQAQAQVRWWQHLAAAACFPTAACCPCPAVCVAANLA